MNLNRLCYFAAVVDTGSFTGAAERLGVTKAVVSQQVAQLEHDLRTSLLVRTTRRVRPTEAGRMFHARCIMILREAGDAIDELAQSATEPSGTLRLTAPNDYGTEVVIPVITEFTTQFPNCRVELTLSDETFDLLSGEIDLAIRVGWLTDSGLQSRKIGFAAQLDDFPLAVGCRFGVREAAHGRSRSGRSSDLAVRCQHGTARPAAVAFLTAGCRAALRAHASQHRHR